MHFVHFANVIGCNNMLIVKVCKILQRFLQTFGAFILFYFILHVQVVISWIINFQIQIEKKQKSWKYTKIIFCWGLTTYLEVTAVDPSGKSISQLGHVFTVQRRLFVMKIWYKFFANLQAPLGVCRQDARQKVVQCFSHHYDHFQPHTTHCQLHQCHNYLAFLHSTKQNPTVSQQHYTS